MILTIIAIVILIGIAIAVKLYDERIRSSKYGKTIVVGLFLIAIALLISQFIVFVIGG